MNRNEIEHDIENKLSISEYDTFRIFIEYYSRRALQWHRLRPTSGGLRNIPFRHSFCHFIDLSIVSERTFWENFGSRYFKGSVTRLFTGNCRNSSVHKIWPRFRVQKIGRAFLFKRCHPRYLNGILISVLLLLNSRQWGPIGLRGSNAWRSSQSVPDCESWYSGKSVV